MSEVGQFPLEKLALFLVDAQVGSPQSFKDFAQIVHVFS